MDYDRQENPLRSEEDIRTKIVTTWLADHGFGAADISLEKTFEIRLGRDIYRVGSDKPRQSSVFRPRADILVRNRDGKNLLIVEVKAPNETLDDKAREQGISYARLLREGGIAPFVVLTNGYETLIYDSISGDLLNGQAIPTDHPYVKSGFQITGDDLALRSQALEAFISLSPDNLIEFCRLQVSYRMRQLRSDDPYSGKKYIPALYVEREEAKKELKKQIEQERKKVVLIIGSPQVGKTNFICHAIEELIAQGKPCLFYPAIDVRRGLLQQISEDFEWTIADSSSPYQVISKLTHILSKVSQRVVIFIDGWNEASQELARIIDHDSERLLSRNNIQLVISMTNVAAHRLLLNDAGNPSYVAEAASIDNKAISFIEVSPEKRGKDYWSTVHLNKYSDKEMEKAYTNYAKAFKVQVLSKPHVDDPFLLRIAMEHFSNQTLPEELDEPNLLEISIKKKAERAIRLQVDNVCNLLTDLADEIFLKDAPVRQIDAIKRWNYSTLTPIPNGLFESALLARVRNASSLPALDFYFSRERNFVIAYWARDFSSKLIQSEGVIISELSLAVQTQAGTEALKWFLKQRKHQDWLRVSFEVWSIFDEPKERRVLMSSLWENVSQNFHKDGDWILAAMEKGIGDPDLLVRVEAVKILPLVTNDHERLAIMMQNIMEIEEEYPLGEGSAGDVVLDALRQLHWDDCSDGEDSGITIILEPLIGHDSVIIRSGAAKALGHLAPRLFLEILSNKITQGNLNSEAGKEYVRAIELAIRELEELYYGFMCPGELDFLKRNLVLLLEEYERMQQICNPIIEFYKAENCSWALLEILQALCPANNFINYKNSDCIEISIRQLDTEINSENQIKKIKILSYENPIDFLYAISKLIIADKLDINYKNIYCQYIKSAANQIQEIYIESLSSTELELLIEHASQIRHRYKQIYQIFAHLIIIFLQEDCSNQLLEILKNFENIVRDIYIEQDIEEEFRLPSVSDILAHHDQLSLPLDLLDAPMDDLDN